MRLSQIELEVLSKFFEEMDSEFYAGYSWIEKTTGYDRVTLKPAITRLKKLGYLKFCRGLMNDDGEVAGSGWSWDYDKREEIAQLVAAPQPEPRTYVSSEETMSDSMSPSTHEGELTRILHGAFNNCIDSDDTLGTGYSFKRDEQPLIIKHMMPKLQALIAQREREARIEGMKEINQTFAGLWGFGGDGNDHITIYRHVYNKNAQKIAELGG